MSITDVELMIKTSIIKGKVLFIGTKAKYKLDFTKKLKPNCNVIYRRKSTIYGTGD